MSGCPVVAFRTPVVGAAVYFFGLRLTATGRRTFPLRHGAMTKWDTISIGIVPSIVLLVLEMGAARFAVAFRL